MENFIGLIFYIVSFVISFLFYWLYNKYNKKIFVILSFAVPLFIGGLRYNVGTDYNEYVEMYKYNINLDFGFMIITKISKILGNYQFMFFLYQFISLLFIFLGLNNINKELRPFAYFIFLFLSYTTSYNMIRQFLSISIIFYAYKYLTSEKKWHWFFWTSIAFLFHSTAIFYIPFYYLIKGKKGYIKTIIILMILVISLNYVKIIQLLSSYSFFAHYAIYAKEYVSDTNNRMFFVNLLLLSYIFAFRKRLVKYNESNDIYIYLYLLSVALSFTGFFNPFIKRISGYLGMSKIILLSNIPVVCKKSKDKLLNLVVISLFCILIFVLQAFVYGHGDILPYQFNFRN